MSRYSRHIVLDEIGQAGQEKISQAKVLVIGAGGLGCPALQYLTAAGTGTIGIIDFDIVEESNLQRQILFGTSSIGINKAIAAKNRLEDLNPTINIRAYTEQLTHKNALELFEGYDIIVDGTDNFTARYLINDASILTKKPVVYGAIYKFEGQISVFNYKNGPSYRCLFANPPKEGSVPNCSEIGVLGVLPGIIGTMQANEVLKMILGFESVLSGKLFCFNAKTSETITLKITKSVSEIEKVMALKESFSNKNFEVFCESPVVEVSAAEAMQLGNCQFIDVRELGEKPTVELSNCIQIPLGNLEKELNQIDSEQNKIIFCQTGIRSRKAVEILQKHNQNNCYNLKGGAQTILAHQKLEIK
ncbi:MAG: molybdopterin/thiamine biosynthesis adenylyltransferase/rhodanese-related sulfurtransferase [Sediminicola sp.]|jgi:molybdopterin/thiamine biosynthesis adenylyltransferase/rhodanese-related sulfurtransferase